MEPSGGGDESKCTKNGDQDLCKTTPNSCGNNLICCATGECVESGGEEQIGINCSEQEIMSHVWTHINQAKNRIKKKNCEK